MHSFKTISGMKAAGFVHASARTLVNYRGVRVCGCDVSGGTHFGYEFDMSAHFNNPVGRSDPVESEIVDLISEISVAGTRSVNVIIENDGVFARAWEPEQYAKALIEFSARINAVLAMSEPEILASRKARLDSIRATIVAAAEASGYKLMGNQFEDAEG